MHLRRRTDFSSDWKKRYPRWQAMNRDEERQTLESESESETKSNDVELIDYSKSSSSEDLSEKQKDFYQKMGVQVISNKK
jgi:hypothetical protein